MQKTPAISFFLKQRVFIFAAVLLLSGCMESPVFQQQIAVPKNAWAYDFKPTFRFDIDDTVSDYKVYFLIRHTEAYPFSNIWLQLYNKQPGDSTFLKSRVEVPLAQNTGQWIGRGMGEIWEHRMPLTRDDAPMRFKKAGRYEIRFEQNMRSNPLPEVLQVGLRVEKAGHR